jgi:phage recombination protein Bet
MSDNGTPAAVAARPSVTTIATVARTAFEPYQRGLIRHTVAKDCTDAEFEMFLELCVRYELDPFAREIWAAKMGGSDGEGGGRVTILVGRDGLLKVARRTGAYEGMDADVVRENDHFKKLKTGEIEHEYEGGPEKRGAIVGAYAKVYRSGERPTYFFAPWEDYFPKSERRQKKTPWGAQRAAMILKCAQSLALRLAFSITGVVGEDEMTPQMTAKAAAAREIDWGFDPWIEQRLKDLFAAANATRMDAFRPAKQRVMLHDKTDEERRAIIEDLVQFIEEHGGTVPPEPPQRAGEDFGNGPQEVIVDAEVVDLDAEPEPEDPPSAGGIADDGAGTLPGT